MAMGTGKGPPGRVTMAEINVTPMVDVMLVLLILFMVTAPLIQQGVKVNLPQTKAQPIESTDKKLVLTVDARQRVFLGNAEIAADRLEETLKANARIQVEKELYLHADRTLPYGVVMGVMAACQRAGVTHIGMVADPLGAPQAPAPERRRHR